MLEKNRSNQKRAILLCLFLVLAVQVFAQEGIPELETWGQKIVNLFTSGWVEMLCTVALIIEAIMIVVAKQRGETDLIRKFGPWAVGIVIIMAAPSITSFFFKKA